MLFMKHKTLKKLEVGSKKDRKSYTTRTQKKLMWPHLFQTKTKLTLRQEVSLEIEKT